MIPNPSASWVLLLTMSTVFTSSDGYFQEDNASHKAQIILKWSLEHDMGSTVTWSQSSRAPLGCAGTGDSHHGFVAVRSAATAWCYHDNMDQNLWGMFPARSWI